MNGSAMVPHGLILSEDGAIPSGIVFIWVLDLFYAILGAFNKNRARGIKNIGFRA